MLYTVKTKRRVILRTDDLQEARDVMHNQPSRLNAFIEYSDTAILEDEVIRHHVTPVTQRFALPTCFYNGDRSDMVRTQFGNDNRIAPAPQLVKAEKGHRYAVYH